MCSLCVYWPLIFYLHMSNSPESMHGHTPTRMRRHSFLTYHMLMSENNACISAFAAARSRPSVCLCGVGTRVCVCVNVWALGFSRADVSNQSLSRGSLSLYPLSVEPWVDGAGPVHPLVVWYWVVVLIIQMVRHWGGCSTVKGLRRWDCAAKMSWFVVVGSEKQLTQEQMSSCAVPGDEL